MRRIFLLISFIVTASIASADCSPSSVAASREIKIIVPFAVPVGVPVAPFAPYFYSYQQFQQPTVAVAGVAGEHDCPNGSRAQRGSADPSRSEPPVASLLAQRCATCHGGPNPKADLSLEHPDQLSAATRLAAIRAIATGRMLKNKPLTADDSRALIEELSNAP
jgi:hypothetical protein